MLTDRSFRELFSPTAAEAGLTEARTNPRAATLLPVKVTGEDAVFVAACLELSSGGAFLRTPRPLAVGSEVELELAMAGAPVTVRGTVRWSEVDAGGQEGLGVQLAPISPSAREAIGAYRATLVAQRQLQDRFSA